MTSLPIHDALPALREALAERNCVVLVAPPGAGKTTVVPLALLDQPWASGKIIVLEPRRLAARAAAARMASTLGEPVGETVGFRVRMQSRISARTRIEVVTEGVFTRMILDDPALDGVSAVLFDEFHERSLDADLGLALARDSQSVLREDLRLVVMSATLDGARIGATLGDAPLIESLGRQYPVETHYLGRSPALRLEDQVARAVLTALVETQGDLLVFLPGQGEIQRTRERIAERLRDPSVDIEPLYGALDPAAQDRAIAPSPPGRRKVVLATSIAETSLTIEGVRVVIDCGQARVPRYDPARGLTRLETVRVSRASADQRRGRAGRTAPGVCYRLWDEPETRSLPAFTRPEILEADLSRLALDLAQWGAKDASGLVFLDPPPAAAWREARGLLAQLGALDAQGDLTAHGKAMSGLPLAPRLAHMVLRGAEHGSAAKATGLAALLGEQGLGGPSPDLAERMTRWARDSGPRAKDARSLAARWARALPTGPGEMDEGLLLAEAFPERIAKARGQPGDYQLANGRGAYLDPGVALAREPWLAVAELGGGETRDRILLAARLDIDALKTAFEGRMIRRQRLETSPTGVPRAKETLWLGRLAVEERLIADPPAALIRAALVEEARRAGLPWGEAANALRARVAFLRARDPSWPDLADAVLTDDWLGSLLAGKSFLAALSDHALEAALRALVPWDLQRRLDTEAPARWTAPTGNTHAIDYAAQAGPRVDVRVQELFGLAMHPTVAGVPLTLALLSPARRPIQITADLPRFWKTSWADVRKDMRGRYPKHPWPEDPATAAPTTRVKARG